MAKFEPDKPIETREDVIAVEGLPPGAHVFELVVVNDSGNKSDPVQLRLTVKLT